MVWFFFLFLEKRMTVLTTQIPCPNAETTEGCLGGRKMDALAGLYYPTCKYCAVLSIKRNPPCPNPDQIGACMRGRANDPATDEPYDLCKNCTIMSKYKCPNPEGVPGCLGSRKFDFQAGQYYDLCQACTTHDKRCPTDGCDGYRRINQLTLEREDMCPKCSIKAGEIQTVSHNAVYLDLENFPLLA